MYDKLHFRYRNCHVTTRSCKSIEEASHDCPFSRLGRAGRHARKAQRHWQEKADAAGRANPAYSITISREASADGAAVAAEVAKRIGWPVYDRELIERIAREMGLRRNLVDAVDELRKSWLLEDAFKKLDSRTT